MPAQHQGTLQCSSTMRLECPAVLSGCHSVLGILTSTLVQAEAVKVLPCGLLEAQPPWILPVVAACGLLCVTRALLQVSVGSQGRRRRFIARNVVLATGGVCRAGCGPGAAPSTAGDWADGCDASAEGVPAFSGADVLTRAGLGRLVKAVVRAAAE